MHHRMWGLVLALACAVVIGACGGDDQRSAANRSGASGDQPGAGKPAVRLGTKNFTEQFVLGELYAQALRAKGFKVDVKSDIGSSEVTDRALTSGKIDLYPEYTGTALSVVKGQDTVPMTPEETYRRAKAFYAGRGQVLLERTPFQDRDALAVTKAFAAQHHDLRSMGDLRRIGRFTLGAAPEFRTRFAGLLGLHSRYQVRRVDFRPTEIADVYKALDDGDIE